MDFPPQDDDETASSPSLGRDIDLKYMLGWIVTTWEPGWVPTTDKRPTGFSFSTAALAYTIQHIA
jgi:hypothetical protein